MLRATWFLFVLAALAASAMWLADNPGQMRLEWQGYLIETSAAMLFSAFALVAFVAAISYRFWVFLRGVPASIGRVRQEGRRRRGYLALTRGMVAVAAGDPLEARRQGSRADGLLSDPSLTMLLSAQAAQLNGDETAAEKFFTSMLDRPEMEFLGLKGLLSQATRRGDTQEALKWAKRAYQLKPKSEWLGTNLFDLLTRQGQWPEAARTLASAIRYRTVSPVDARRHQAVLNHMLSIQAVADGDLADARKKAGKAYDDTPGFVPAAVHYAGLLVGAGKKRKAASVIEASWRVAPHPDLAAAYWPAAGAEDALSRMKAAQKLCAGHPGHAENHRTLAACALDAGLWGDARHNLQELIASTDVLLTVTVCRMMAELEERENSDLEAARQWLFRAGNAGPDSSWVCRECGNTTRDWTPLCGKCQCFDGFSWSLPLNVPGIASDSSPTLAVMAPAENLPVIALESGTEDDDSPTLLDPPTADTGKKPATERSQDIDEKSGAK